MVVRSIFHSSYTQSAVCIKWATLPIVNAFCHFIGDAFVFADIMCMGRASAGFLFNPQLFREILKIYDRKKTHKIKLDKIQIVWKIMAFDACIKSVMLWFWEIFLFLSLLVTAINFAYLIWFDSFFVRLFFSVFVMWMEKREICRWRETEKVRDR